MREIGGVEHPRVLVVSAVPFGRFTGTGVTLSNLFDGWPAERLALVHTSEFTPSAEVSVAQWCLDSRSAPIDHYLRRLVASGRPMSKSIPSAGTAGSGRDQVRSGPSRLHAQMRAVADLSPLLVPRELRLWVRRFRPDLVYSLLGSVRMMKLASALADEAGVALVPHFMDDWTATLYSNGELLGRARRRFDAHLNRLLRQCRGGFCISRPMAEEYQQRYGLPFVPFVNCVEDSAFGDPEPPHPTGTVRLLYVGGLHLERWRSLRQIAAVLDDPGGTRASLTIHAPQADIDKYGPLFTDFTRTRVGRPLTGTEVPAALTAADVLVHVESFDENIRRYTRLSLSTKIPQYLAAGRPILGFGPAEVASMRHILAAEGGIVVGRPDPDLLAAGITELSGDLGLRRRLANNGHLYASRHHRKGPVAADFATYLTALAHGDLRDLASVVAP